MTAAEMKPGWFTRQCDMTRKQVEHINKALALAGVPLIGAKRQESAAAYAGEATGAWGGEMSNKELTGLLRSLEWRHWESTTDPEGYQTWTASTVFGSYTITRDEGKITWRYDRTATRVAADSISEAKRQVWDNYCERIGPALKADND